MPDWLTDLLKDRVYLCILDCSAIPVGSTIVKLPSGKGLREVTITRVGGDTDIIIRDSVAALDASFIKHGTSIAALGFVAGSGVGVLSKEINLNSDGLLRQNNLVNVGLGIVVSRLL